MNIDYIFIILILIFITLFLLYKSQLSYENKKFENQKN